MRILVIEDEPRMLELLRRGLHERDCAVVTATDGEAGLELATRFDFEAILLDIGLPNRDGFEVVRELRQRSIAARVLMLTARDGEDDIIRGLDLGADDYITKPFSFPELMARLQSMTRRRAVAGNKIEVDDLAVDLVRRSVTRGTRNVDLSRTEFTLLLMLMRSAGQCVSRQSLMEGVWGADHQIGSGALDVLINSLRSKLELRDATKLIYTVRGVGYALNRQWKQDRLVSQ